MAKTFDIDFRKGTLVDSAAGITGTITGLVPMVKSDKGLAVTFNGNQSNFINFGTNAAFSFPTSIMSLDCWVRIRKGGIYRSIVGTLSNLGAGTAGFDLAYLPALGLIWFGISGGADSNHASFPVIYDKWIHIIGYCNGINNYIIVNGVAGTPSAKGALTGTQTRDLELSYDSNASNCGNVDIARIRLFNHVLTEAERAKSYLDFLNSYPLDAVKTPDYQVLKPMDLSREVKDTLTQVTINPWLVDAGAPTINGNIVTFNTTNDGVRSPGTLVGGKLYRMRFIVSNIVGGGGLTLIYNGAVSNNTIYYNGVYEYEYTDPSVNCFMYSLGSTGTVEVVYILEVTGLVAAYNMIPNGTILTDISGNGKNGTLVGAVTTLKDGIDFKGRSYVQRTGAALPYPCSYSFRIMLRNAGGINYIVDGGLFTNPYVLIYGNNVYFQWYNGAGTWMAKAGSGAIIQNNKIYNITCTTDGTTSKIYLDGVDVTTTGLDTTVSAGNVLMGNVGTSEYANGVLYDMRCYNRVLTAQEAKDYHNQFAKRITLLEDFRYEGADGIAKVPAGWSKQSGSFKIGEFQISRKYLECVTAGTIAIPSKQAYGTWEFDYYSGNAIADYWIHFIKNGTNYHALQIYDKVLYIRLSGGSYYSTPASYFNSYTFYRIKITRSSLGVFTLYAKGGSLGNNTWTLLPMAVGTNPFTDNTITTSEKILLDIDAGDRITNIKLTEGVEQKSEVLGENLVVNSWFDSNISGWTNHGTYSFDVCEWSAGRLHIVSNGVQEGSPFQCVYQQVPLVSGRTYYIEFDAEVIGSGFNILLENIPVGSAIGFNFIVGTTGHYSGYFVPSASATFYADIYKVATVAGEIYVDNFVIKEVLND
jgi:hypothetical protein